MGATPGDWRELAKARGGESAPTQLGDGRTPCFAAWEGGGGDPDDALDRAVRETREAVFPHLGLDPLAADG